MLCSSTTTLLFIAQDTTRVSHTTVFIQFTTTAAAIYNDIRSDDDYVIALSRDVQMSLRIHLYQALIISIQSKLHIELIIPKPSKQNVRETRSLS